MDYERGAHEKDGGVFRMAEADEQKIIAAYLDYSNLLWFHPANEAKRSAHLAAMLKAQGLKAGVPDVCILEPVGAKHGLFIEMKYGANKPTAEQKKWLSRLSARGYATAICYSADDAIKIVKEYMRGKY